MIISPIISMLHNTKLSRWHPIIFRESPLPGGGGSMQSIRYKSVGHHTEGFETREAALAAIDSIIEKITPDCVGPVVKCLDGDFLWDGEGIPAMVVFFATEDGKAIPLF
jgi:hypothetical protein